MSALNKPWRVTTACNGAGGRAFFDMNASRAGPLMRTVTRLRPMPEYIVNLFEVGSTEDLLAAFNASLFKYVGGRWETLNLDAFNDYLDWLEPKYRLTLTGWNDCHVLDTIHGPSRRPLREVMLEIIADHPGIELRLR